MNAFRNKCPHCTFCANNKAVLKVHLENLHENQRIQPTIAVEKMDSNILNPKISDTQHPWLGRQITSKPSSPPEIFQ